MKYTSVTLLLVFITLMLVSCSDQPATQPDFDSSPGNLTSTEFSRPGQTHLWGMYEITIDAENLTGALRLYEKAGMHVHQQFDIYEKEIRSGKEISVQSLGD